MKIYLSADMEGTAGIVHWDETTAGHPQYGYFQEQMSREVAAACQGALDAGATEILVKDAHDSARSIIPTMLPEQARLFRGWNDTPEMMMAGLDESFDGVLFTGYHAAAGSSANPLSHTMDTRIYSLRCNGRLLAEFDINAMIAASYGVPVYFLSGDRGLCDAARETVPQLQTVATNEGSGSGAISLQPGTAARNIRETAAKALRLPKAACLYPMPGEFKIELSFKDHIPAAKAENYPGVTRRDAKTVCFETRSFQELLRTFYWIL